MTGPPMENGELEALVAVFRAEAAETLDTLAQSLESLRGTTPADRIELLQTALSLTHNLKGASQSVGLDQVARVAHGLEDELQAIRDEPSIEEAAIGAMLREVSVMQRLADGVEPDSASLRQRLSGPGPQGSTQRRPSSATVRVEAHRIDRLMGFTGELLVAQAAQAARAERLERLAGELGAHISGARSGEAVGWEELTQRLEDLQRSDRRELMRFGNLTSELKEALKAVRMVRLGAMAAGWRRTVRETAQTLGKAAKLQVSVGEIEIDKQVLDRLHDPLLHILRNAVDHGIEPPEERQRKKKPALGNVAVSADIQGTMVRIEISDDGRGVDVERVVEVARENELTDVLQQGDSTDVLFDDRFSTATEVTEISGRGVGLSVVRRAVEELGGRVDLVPRGALGGAIVALIVPSSVLSTRELLVRAGSATCAVPIESIERALRLDQAAVGRLEGAPAASVDGIGPLRIVWLARLLGARGVEERGRLSVLVVRRGPERLGIVVDEVLQQGEFVIQRLPWNLESVPGISGAIILADGSLAVAVDVAEVFERARHRDPEPGLRPAGRSVPAVLVVDDSLTTRTLHRNVLLGAGYEVSMAANGAEAWELLCTKNFDLVVADVLMPEVDGWELTRRIRRHGQLSHIPVVLVTSLESPQDKERGAQVGANAYVVKGQYDEEKLLEAVISHV